MEVYIQTDAIFVKEAYEAARRGDTDLLESLQELYSASKPARELHAASLKTGRSLMFGIKNLHEGETPELFGRLKDPTFTYHYAIAYGIVAAVMEMPPDETLLTYIYAGLASLVSVASRIIPLGQNESQLVLFRLSRRLSSLELDYEELALKHVNTFAPGLEIAAMEHETLYTRLCMS
jgi:urease accessory protein